MAHPFWKRIKKRRMRRGSVRPQLTVPQILAWADAHHQRWRKWPTRVSGRIPGALGETWSIVNQALQQGYQGLEPGSSLARLLAKHRGYRNRLALPPLTIEQILQWADAHYQRTGTWPQQRSGPISEAPGETWSGVDVALAVGGRGRSGGSSLAFLLQGHRGRRNMSNLPPLSIRQVLSWADAHYQATGHWPKKDLGAIVGAPEEMWSAVDSALREGVRGFPRGSSLARQLAAERGVPNEKDLPRLSEQQILQWADAHHQRRGVWPKAASGPIADAPGETWEGITSALRAGFRGLRGGSSLARLLAEYRGVRNKQDLPPVAVEQILEWADKHYRRTGRWPNRDSGPVTGAPGETWETLDAALKIGYRGLPPGSSLTRLLALRRNVPRKGGKL
jgi:hypothetical protein